MRNCIWLFALCLPPLAAAAVLFETPATEALVKLREEARSYEHGEGVAKDALRAVGLYCEAARLGDAEAQYSLGWMYANGRGVPRDDETAAYFFKLAADQGNEAAGRMLRFVGDKRSPMPSCMQTETAVPIADEIESPPTPAQKKIFALVQKLAPQYGVSSRLAIAIIRAESNFEASAVSSRNAQGLMQLIPETCARFNVRKPFDPEQNIRGGLSYLRWLLAYFEGDVALVAAAYNAGEGIVNRYGGVPPYPETRRYVRQILGLFKAEAHAFDRAVTPPSPELPRIRSVRRRP